MRIRAVTLLVLVGCGGARFDGRSYRDGDVAYEVGALGEGWQRVEVDGNGAGADLAWSHPSLAAVAHVEARCDPALDVPLDALTNHLLVGFTDRRDEVRERIPMDGREALRTHLRARLDGVERELLLVVLKKDGCVYDLGLVAPPGTAFARARSDFERLLGGFRARSRPP
ncbi:MAG: hypothetical protein NZ898_08080 [Myxococcota bacterium]|nr:hypothetical protein [Myxococcota bacterium]MDW8363183.1 hypothetical protein [Myxococcales bacterium]